MVTSPPEIFDNSKLSGKLLLDEPLKRYTSWRVGGNARRIYFPADIQDLSLFLKSLDEQEELFWMGLGSNLLIRDGGIQATIINTRSSLKSMQKTTASSIRLEAGVYCAQAARFCGRENLTGAEFLAGIPGTIGGALMMNAGAFGNEIWNIIEQVEMITSKGELLSRPAADFETGYRSVKKNDKEWFVAATVALQQGDTQKSEQKIRELLNKRSQTQPINQLSCGSVFKNPHGLYAAKLIEECGLKGYSIGKAQVSEKHANFIINTGDARAADIEALIKHIQQQVASQTGITLKPEVRIVGVPE